MCRVFSGFAGLVVHMLLFVAQYASQMLHSGVWGSRWNALARTAAYIMHGMVSLDGYRDLTVLHNTHGSVLLYNACRRVCGSAFALCHCSAAEPELLHRECIFVV